jgi:2-aminoethylphosphonate-pyruvate transaminase
MLRDFGSRSEEFIRVVREVRQRVLGVVAPQGDTLYECIPLQGSGTYAIEAALGTFVPRAGRLLVIENGAYGRRISQLAQRLGLAVDRLAFGETDPIDWEAVEQALRKGYSHMALVHLETSTGRLNPLEEFARRCRQHGVRLLVDAMTTLGGVPIDIAALGLCCLISSSNKALEGAPGLGLCLVASEDLESSVGHPTSISLDLKAQWEALEQTGQFRFTPPTHVVMALEAALHELDREGGVAARAKRYRGNRDVLVAELEVAGHRPLLPPEQRGWMITSFFPPEGCSAPFSAVARQLEREGLVIYPGKSSEHDTYRIGSMGQLGPDDMREVAREVARAYAEVR